MRVGHWGQAGVQAVSKRKLGNFRSAFTLVSGILEQLLVAHSDISADCMKTCVRRCPNLKLLDVRGLSDENVDVDAAEEIANLWGGFGQTPRLVLRSTNQAWRSERVQEIQLSLKEGALRHSGRFVIDPRSELTGFLEEFDDDDGNTLVYEDDPDAMSDYSGSGGWGIDIDIDDDYYGHSEAESYEDEDQDDEDMPGMPF